MGAASFDLSRGPSTMRTTLVALCLLACPALARAELTFEMGLLDEPRGGRAASLGFRDLSLDGRPSLALSVKGDELGEGSRIEPGLALILGVVPGFGVGHYFAHSPQWTVWLVADIVIFVVWPGGFIFTDSRGYSLAGLFVLVERAFEGLSAFQAAGGEAAPLAPGVEASRSPAERALPFGALGAPSWPIR